LENLAGYYTGEMIDMRDTGGAEGKEESAIKQMVPADYVVTQLEALTMTYHYCLLDNTSQVLNEQIPNVVSFSIFKILIIIFSGQHFLLPTISSFTICIFKSAATGGDPLQSSSCLLV